MEPFIGQILLFSFTLIPNGFAQCDGSILPIAQYPALFSLIGNRFGGDGKTNFALPNYTKISPAGSRYCIALTGVFPAQ